MKSSTIITTIAAILIVSLAVPVLAQKEGVKATMFHEVDSVMAVASAADAAIL